MNQLDLFKEPKSEPEPPQSLRYYQQDCVDSIIRGFDHNRSLLAVLATGLGKTVIFSSIATHWPGPVLVLAHRSELVDQAAKKLAQSSGEPVEIEQAQLYAGRARIIVGSVQTVTRDHRVGRIAKMWDKHYPKQAPLIITDEAHHYTSPSFRKPLDVLKSAKVLGVTATPNRSDKQAMGKVFDDYPFVMGIEDGIEEGWLVPIRGREVLIKSINLDSVSVTAGDFQAGQLDEEMMKAAETVAQKTLEYEPGRQGIVFCPGVKSAHLTAEKFNALKPGSASCIDGKTDKFERNDITRRFRSGEIQYLVNCQVATEGFDAPGCSLIVQARPTKSQSLYAQMVGRGTRVLPESIQGLNDKDQAEQRRAGIEHSPKSDCVVLDFVGNSKHSLICPTDILGGNYTNPEKKKAKALQKKNPDDDAITCLKKARAMLKAIASRSKAKVSAEVHPFDPFRVMGLSRDENDKARVSFGKQPLSEEQRKLLEKKKVPKQTIDSMGKRDFTRFLNEMSKRQKLGLATYRQLAYMKKFGFHDTNVSFKAGNKVMTYIARQGWGRKGVSAQTIERIVRAVDKKGQPG